MVTTDIDAAPARRVRKIDWSAPFVYFVALAVVGTAISPVLYVIISGFRTTKQLNENLAGWPDPWTFSTYARVLFGEDTLFWSQAFTSSGIL